ncbi:MAG TPA: WD40 repeat domain-containing protein [Pirellulaceae bacterium]|nr:WD40 repeat domain-containing protein [Pirellulaceae bacterium]
MLRPTLLRAAILAAFALTCPALGQEEPKLDTYGDPLPLGAVLRLGTIRLQATGGFAWMPDGKSLVTFCAGRIWFWDVADGRPLRSLPALGNTGTHHYSLAVSQDGSKLVCASVDGDISIHDLKSGREIPRPQKRDGADPRLESPGVDELALAPDGTSFVTANYRQHVRLWDTETGEVLLRLPVDERQNEYPCVAYSPDSRFVAYGCGTTIRIFDLEDPAKPAVFDSAHGEETTAIAFTPDGKSLISIGTSKYERRQTPGGKSYITNHCELRIWNLAEKRLQHELPFPERMGGAGLMALAPDGKSLVTWHGETSLVWDLSERKVIRKLPPLTTRYSRTRMKAAIDASGKYLAVNCNEKYLRVWDVASGQELFSPDKRHTGWPFAACYSHSGRLIATGDSNGLIRIWDASSGELVRSITGSDGSIRGLAFTKDDSRLIVGAEGHDDTEIKFVGRLKAFNVADGSLVFEQVFPNRVMAISLSHDNNKIAVGSGLGEAFLEPGSDPMVHVSDASSGKTLGEWKAGEGKIAALAWSKDNRFLVYAAEDNKICTIDVQAGEQTGQLDVPHERVQMDKVVPDRLSHAWLMPDRDRAITCTTLGIHRWDLKQGAKIWSLTTSGSRNMRIALSPDERVVASAWTDFERQQCGLTLWEVATRKQLLELAMPREQVYSIVFSPDGRRIVTGLETGSLLVWDVSAAWQQLSVADGNKK